MDLGLRRHKENLFHRHPLVSILGLVDLGLRLIGGDNLPRCFKVSILGLVDLGLRRLQIQINSAGYFCFNPWFSGFRVETRLLTYKRLNSRTGFNPWFSGFRVETICYSRENRENYHKFQSLV